MMKKLFILTLFVSCLWATDLVLQEQLLNCSKMKISESRLACFDRLTQKVTPKSEEDLRGQILTQNCLLCHGQRWELPKKVGSLAVRHMKQEHIYQSLLKYKQKSSGSVIMQNQMIGMTKKEIELISKYIVKSVNQNK